MPKAFFWMTHGHRPQRSALESVKRAFGGDVRTIGSRFDGRFEFVPADVVWDEPEDMEAFVDMVENRAGTLSSAFGVPVVLVAMKRRRALVRHADRLARAGVVLLAGAGKESVLELCDDKMAFADFMLSRFPDHAVPTRLVSDPVELDEAVASIEADGTQACVKPPVGMFGHGFRRLSRIAFPSAMFTGDRDFEENRVVSTDLFRALYAMDPKPVLVMPFLEGEEISIDALFRSGKLVRAVSRRKMDSMQQIGPDASLIFPPIGPIGNALGLDGIVNMQVRRRRESPDEPYRVLEINTRYAGGTDYLVSAGIDLFSDAVSTATGLTYKKTAPLHMVDIAVRAKPVGETVRRSVPWSAS